MAGARLSVTLDGEAFVRQMLTELVSRPEDLRDVFDEIGASLVTSTQQRFEDEKDPEGKPWPELSEAYQQTPVTKKHLRGSEHILRLRGHLYASITHLATPLELQVGSNRRYAAIHQLGGTEDMAPGPAAVPARAYLGISAEDEREIVEILMEHLGGGG